jgi:hypothetical protein
MADRFEDDAKVVEQCRRLGGVVIKNPRDEVGFRAPEPPPEPEPEEFPTVRSRRPSIG